MSDALVLEEKHASQISVSQLECAPDELIIYWKLLTIGNKPLARVNYDLPKLTFEHGGFYIIGQKDQVRAKLHEVLDQAIDSHFKQLEKEKNNG